MARCFALAGVLGALLVPSSAFGQEDGVTIDPSSAAGKEYAIPLEAARGMVGGAPKTAAAAPLFGAGIRPKRSASSSTGPATGSVSGSGSETTSRREGTASRDPGTKRSRRSPREALQRVIRPVGAAVEPPTGLWTGAFALLALALGALGAYGARRLPAQRF